MCVTSASLLFTLTDGFKKDFAKLSTLAYGRVSKAASSAFEREVAAELNHNPPGKLGTSNIHQIFDRYVQYL